MAQDLWRLLRLGTDGALLVATSILAITQVTYTGLRPDTSSVSGGFYGPGTFYAWLSSLLLRFASLLANPPQAVVAGAIDLFSDLRLCRIRGRRRPVAFL